MSGALILESKRARLTKDRFVYDGKAYLTSDIRRASLKSGLFKPTMLVLEFKNGENKEFRIGTTLTSSHLNVLTTDGLIDTVSQDVGMATPQWVTTINMLLRRQQSGEPFRSEK
jgi:hypothetical protein